MVRIETPKVSRQVESLSSRDQKNLDKVYKRGNVVLQGKDTDKGTSITLYSVLESRGAQTKFEPKEFFYVVGLQDNRVVMAKPITRGFQGRSNREMYDYWNDTFLVMVEDQDALDRWLNKTK